MTTKLELLATLESIEESIAEHTKALKPTVLQRLKFFLSQRTIASWRAESTKRKNAHIEKIKQLQTRSVNINKAISMWLDAGDVIGKYDTERKEYEW